MFPEVWGIAGAGDQSPSLRRVESAFLRHIQIPQSSPIKPSRGIPQTVGGSPERIRFDEAIRTAAARMAFQDG